MKNVIALGIPQRKEEEPILAEGASDTMISSHAPVKDNITVKKDTRRMREEKLKRIQASIQTLDQHGPISLNDLCERIDRRLMPNK